MSIRKRIQGAREERAKARSERREEARQAERAKRIAKAERVEKAAPDPGPSKRRVTTRPRSGKTAFGEGPTAREERPAKLAARQERGPEPSPANAAKHAAQRPRAGRADARRLGSGAASAGSELLKLGREMIAIPVGLWLAAAEVVGAFVLRAWRRALRPALAWLWRAARAAVRWGERHLTPARAVAAVAIVACGALAASQWLDYRAVSVGIDAYAGEVGAIAPPPEVESEIAGNAHAWVMVPLAAAGLVAIGFALAGRRRVAIALVPVGLAVIAISLIVDAPKGLDEGIADLAYEEASASLLEGFWMQLATATVLVACGLLLPRYLRPQSAKELAASRLTGPTLFERAAVTGRRLGERRPSIPRPKVSLPKRGRPKRKVQGART